MFLNDSIIRNARPGPKPRKLKDGDGLFLLVQPTGAWWWRMRYTVRGVEKVCRWASIRSNRWAARETGPFGDKPTSA